jgi:hypothetical protein
MLGGEVVGIPGFTNKLLAQSVRLGPRAMVRKIGAGLNTPQKQDPTGT